MSGIDDFVKMVEEDELHDRATLATKLTPIEYGKLRGIAPQRVYYHLRTGKLQFEYCNCGRKVVDVKKADEIFEFTTKEEEDGDENGIEENSTEEERE
jgi:hypothetical protein